MLKQPRSKDKALSLQNGHTRRDITNGDNSTQFHSLFPKAFMVLYLFVHMKTYKKSSSVKNEKKKRMKFKTCSLSHLCTPGQYPCLKSRSHFLFWKVTKLVGCSPSILKQEKLFWTLLYDRTSTLRPLVVGII